MLDQYIGLTEKQAEEKIKEFGLNEIPKEKKHPFIKFLKGFLSPVALLMFLAAFLSLILDKAFDFYFILILMFINAAVGFWQEFKAENAIEKLNQKISLKAKVFRGDEWKEIDSKYLVPGDIIELAIGDIFPADAVILEEQNLSINESMVTGESLPIKKKVGEGVYLGSFLATGIAIAKISSTGRSTYFGKTLMSVEKTREKSLLEKDVLNISKMLTYVSLSAIGILTVIFLLEKVPIAEIITLDLTLAIAGIPIALPTVMTLIAEIGVLELAKKNIVVRRISALEDLSNVDLFLVDKTGTLTKNKITVADIIAYDNMQPENVMELALAGALKDKKNAINKAIEQKAKNLKIKNEWQLVKFIPADSVRKRETLLVEKNNKKIIISIGSPRVIYNLCALNLNRNKKFNADINLIAKKGYRAIAIAYTDTVGDEKNMNLAGIISLRDEIRKDAKDVIAFLEEKGIEVKMVTGDSNAISAEVAEKVGISGNVISRAELEKMSDEELKNIFKQTSVFAEILPDDKYKLTLIAKKDHITAVTGDGVNDIPAVKSANVGIAVYNAVDALKNIADIVLFSDGISMMKEMVMESRKIFARIYSYSVYRISESFRLIITVLVLGVIFKEYPLTPVQLIFLALLNDIPIISLAYDRVKAALKPEKINVRERFVLGSLFGLTGVLNSLILFFFLIKFTDLDIDTIQTLYFLKLSVGGHLLVFVAHTKDRWFRFLPSREVIFATVFTQIIATIVAVSGVFMHKISFKQAIFIWIWAFVWMQISDLMKLGKIQGLFKKNDQIF